MKYINTINGVRPYNLTLQVGDEIVGHTSGYERYYLAIRIGPYYDEKSELWFAWTHVDGHLCTVAVGDFWKLKVLDKNYQEIKE